MIIEFEDCHYWEIKDEYILHDCIKCGESHSPFKRLNGKPICPDCVRRYLLREKEAHSISHELSPELSRRCDENIDLIDHKIFKILFDAFRDACIAHGVEHIRRRYAVSERKESKDSQGLRRECKA